MWGEVVKIELLGQSGQCLSDAVGADVVALGISKDPTPRVATGLYLSHDQDRPGR